MPESERPCECGCGGTVYGMSRHRATPKRFIAGHNRRGATISEEQRKKVGDSNRGRPSWVAGMGQPGDYKEISKYNSNKRWTRNLFKKLKDDACWTCKKCGTDKSMHTRGLHIHHIDFNPLNNDVYNLEVLCVLCHRRVHNKIMYENYLKNMEVCHRSI